MFRASAASAFAVPDCTPENNALRRAPLGGGRSAVLSCRTGRRARGSENTAVNEVCKSGRSGASHAHLSVRSESCRAYAGRGWTRVAGGAARLPRRILSAPRARLNTVRGQRPPIHCDPGLDSERHFHRRSCCGVLRASGNSERAKSASFPRSVIERAATESHPPSSITRARAANKRQMRSQTLRSAHKRAARVPITEKMRAGAAHPRGIIAPALPLPDVSQEESPCAPPPTLLLIALSSCCS